VRQLGASDFEIGLINTVNSGIVMLGYFVWTALTRRRGNVLVLQISFGLTLYPLLTALASDIAPIVEFAAIAGIFGAGINLVLFDISLATVPADKVASSIAVYQLTTHAATLVAPMIGTFLGDQLG
jgi:predicted MFS family arabinose efflux permease